MSYLYILKFENGKSYVGSTINLDRRLAQHKSGHTASTKRLDSTFTLEFSQELPTLKQARQIERKIKSWKRKDFIERIIKDGYIKVV